MSYSQKLDWDDKIPDDLRNVWSTNLDLMQGTGRMFHRAVVPDDAINLNIETIDTGDASKDLI